MGEPVEEGFGVEGDGGGGEGGDDEGLAVWGEEYWGALGEFEEADVLGDDGLFDVGWLHAIFSLFHFRAGYQILGWKMVGCGGGVWLYGVGSRWVAGFGWGGRKGL